MCPLMRVSAVEEREVDVDHGEGDVVQSMTELHGVCCGVVGVDQVQRRLQPFCQARDTGRSRPAAQGSGASGGGEDDHVNM